MLQAHPDIKVRLCQQRHDGGRRAARRKGRGQGQVKIIGTDGLPGPAGGIEAVAKGDWAATFTYPTGAKEAIEMAKSILLDCATSVEPTVTVDDHGDHRRERQAADGQVDPGCQHLWTHGGVHTNPLWVLSRAVPRSLAASTGLGLADHFLTGVLSLLGRPIGSLSGGEHQRAQLRAIAQEPRIQFLDEAANHLDPV